MSEAKDADIERKRKDKKHKDLGVTRKKWKYIFTSWGSSPSGHWFSLLEEEILKITFNITVNFGGYVQIAQQTNFGTNSPLGAG
jgi:hypothetical protein